MGESRGELLQWLKETLNFPCRKIEECGTGVVYFFILDSIYRDIPIHKVNLNARHEYEFINNFKLLQSIFDKKGISYNIPIEKLVKCKFQDNLEFLQRIKKFWISKYKDEGKYDSLSKISSCEIQFRRTSDYSGINSGLNAKNNRKISTKTKSIISETNTKSLENEVGGLKPEETDTDDLIKQIKFYYWKLCNIEETLRKFYDKDKSKDPLTCLEEIKTILYETEEGFEIPVLDNTEKKV